MKYLQKRDDSAIVARGLSYATRADRPRIRELLLVEQDGFCAYSEAYVRPIDEVHLEHFDPRAKGTPEDGYWNWYATLPWMNSHKPKRIEPFLPIADPGAPDLAARVLYRDHLYVEADAGDAPTRNLIAFLGVNRPELRDERRKHVRRIEEMLPFLSWEEMRSDPANRQFATALAAVLGIDG